MNDNDTLSKLEKLSALKEKGVLTEAEFQEQKQRIIEESKQKPTVANTSNFQPITKEKKKTGCFTWLVAIFMMIFVVPFCIWVGIKSGTEKSSSRNQNAPANTATSPTVKKLSNLTYAQVDRSAKKLTDLQFDKYAESLKGTHVKWTGVIVDVKQKLLGGYKVMLDMDDTGVQDVYVELGEKQALELKKGSQMTVEGDITSVVKVLGMVSVDLNVSNYWTYK